jgi:16S rRNA (guanine(966)-N(2))-methyltransferase RsmD
MRIIAGSLKGRTLEAPTWDGLRPTSDKLRETLFNVLSSRVPDSNVLDVFAGSGALGLEALSRGASRVVFVEHDRRAAALIGSNVTRCGVNERCVIIRDAAERVLQNPIDGDPFDLVMLDPPYGFEPLADVVHAAAKHLAPEGLLILEHATRRVPPALDGMQLVRTVRSGDSSLTMFEVR